jgi:PAS domain S-box-containing protein
VLRIRLRLTTIEAFVAYLPVAAWGAAAIGAVMERPFHLTLFLSLAIGAATLWALARERRPWLPLVHLTSVVAAGGLLLFVNSTSARWWIGIAGFVSATMVALSFRTLRHRIRVADEERRGLARQVDRRINEIFSLQELSYILAESLQSERIAGQISRYVMRFLNVEGAAVGLPVQTTGGLFIAAAEGSLSNFQGRYFTDDPPSLLLRANLTERIEVISGSEVDPVPLIPGFRAVTGAAAPLRAHGLTMGVLVLANRRQGAFSAEDLWLLSTVSTHVAVVMANSRLFEMIRQAKDEWETAFNSLTEGIAVLDGAGHIGRANDALGRLLGRTPAALLGLPFWLTVMGNLDGEDRLLGVARRGDHTVSLTLRSLATQRVLRLNAAPLGEPAADAAVVVLVEDVTEQRALEAQLIQSEKLAAVGQLVSGVAHELNNPLTSIAGLSEFLQERSGLGDKDREHLRVIHEQADRAGRIVRNLLTFARKGSPSEGTVDLNDVLGRTALLVAYELHLRGIDLVEDRVQGPLPVRGNRDELQQVVLNLVNNAVQAVRNLPDGVKRQVTLASAVEGDQAVIRVRDSGPGVQEELVPQLFTPFFTTKEPGEGTGLGLSLSYRIVESHGGRLAFRPVPEGGAEFSFRLPLVDPDRRSAPHAVPGGDPFRPAALVVDSDPGAELVVRALFEPAGYMVEVARTGAEGLARLSAREWDVIVLDGGMSADGRRLLVEQVESEPGRRVLVTTADAGLAARCRSRDIPVLPKPFLPRDLVAVAGGLLVS